MLTKNVRLFILKNGQTKIYKKTEGHYMQMNRDKGSLTTISGRQTNTRE